MSRLCYFLKPPQIVCHIELVSALGRRTARYTRGDKWFVWEKCFVFLIDFLVRLSPFCQNILIELYAQFRTVLTSDVINLIMSANTRL